MSFTFVKHFELPCVERCYINEPALPNDKLCLNKTNQSDFRRAALHSDCAGTCYVTLMNEEAGNNKGSLHLKMSPSTPGSIYFCLQIIY